MAPDQGARADENSYQAGEIAPPVIWHDAKREPDPPGHLMWIYLVGTSTGFEQIELATYSRPAGWHSALNPEVQYDTDAVQAWAVIEYPEVPERCWRAPPLSGTDQQEADDA